MQKSALDLFLEGYDNALTFTNSAEAVTPDFPLPTASDIEAEERIITRYWQATPTFKRPNRVSNGWDMPLQKQMMRVAIPNRRMINQGRGSTLDKTAQRLNNAMSGHTYVWIEATNNPTRVHELYANFAQRQSLKGN